MFWLDLHWQLQQALLPWWWTIQIVIISILGVATYYSYKKPIYSLAIITALLPTYLLRSNIGWLPFTFLELLIWFTFFGWLMQAWKRNTLFSTVLRNYRLGISIILLASIFSVIIAPSITAAAGLWKAYIIQPLLLFIIAKNIIVSKKDLQYILIGFGISALYLALFALYQKLTGVGIPTGPWVAPETRRVTSLFTSPNALGMYLAPLCSIFIGYSIANFKQAKKTSIFLLTTVVISLLSLIFTKSEGTFIGLAVSVGVFLWFTKYRKLFASLAIALVALVTLIASPLGQHINQPVHQKIYTTLTFQDQSGQNRLWLWNLAWQQLTSSPQTFIFGTGLFGFSEIQNQTRNPDRIEALLYPHNILLNFWTELGLLGVIGFLLILCSFFKKFRQTAQLSSTTPWLHIGIVAAILGLLAHGIVDVPYFKNDLAIIFWLLIAML